LRAEVSLDQVGARSYRSEVVIRRVAAAAHVVESTDHKCEVANREALERVNLLGAAGMRQW
jgi:hypothetical protein